MGKNKTSSSGFTVVELLMAAALSIVVAAAVLSTVSRGADIWRRASKAGSDTETAFFFDKFTEDIRNCQAFPEIGFWGNKNSMAFPSVVLGRNFGSPVPGKVLYSYGGKVITRTQLDYSDIYTGEGDKKEMLGGIESAAFSYYVYDDIAQVYLWMEETEEIVSPLAVRVEIKMMDGENERVYTKTVSIPVGGK